MAERKRLFRVRQNDSGNKPQSIQKLVLPEPEPQNQTATSLTKPRTLSQQNVTTGSLRGPAEGESKLRIKMKVDRPPVPLPVEEKLLKPNVAPRKETPKVQPPQEKIPPPKKEPLPPKEHPEGQFQLIQCREGCGRKFNPTALEKHQKACKIVFQSRRKQFNTQQQRVISKEQADILKQNQRKEKKEGLLKDQRKEEKDRWKKESEEFREVVKNVKEVEAAGQTRRCPGCGQLFNEVFLGKHQEGCLTAKKGKKK